MMRMMVRALCLVTLIGVMAASPALAGADEAVPALLAAGRVDDALAALHGQIISSPNDPVAQNLLCRAYFALADFERSIPACERAVSLAPENSDFHLWLGRSYGGKADKAGMFAAAKLAGKVRTEFETAVRLNPTSVDAHSDLAEFYLEAPGIVGGGRDKAEQQANSLLALNPARAHWVNARIAEKKKDLSRAESEYHAAIDSSRGSASSWLNLGLFYRHREQWDEMVEALSHVRSAPLDRPDALVDAGEILIHSQRVLPEAVALLRAYLDSRSKTEQAPAFRVHYLLGTAQEKLGDRQNAAAEYRAALDLAREFQPARQALDRINR